MTSLRRCEYPYDNHPGVVINRAKFDVCMASSFGGVKAYVRTKIALYILDLTRCCLLCFLTDK